MYKKLTSIKGLVGAAFFLLIAMVVLVGCAGGTVQPAASGGTSVPAADPQRLMIPRWFLSSLTLDGQAVAVAEDQQAVTIQFTEDGNANGTGGCNDFGTTFSTGPDGKMAFGPVAATKMACAEGMELENALFQALSKVERFNTEDFQLVMSSADGKTSLTFRMPPK